MFFKENSDAIIHKNPELAALISSVSLSEAQEYIELFPSESGEYVLSYEGLMLDDLIDPKLDARLNAEDNISTDFSSNDIIVVFGLGTGYLLDYICNNYSSKIVFIEPNLQIFRYALEFLSFKDVFNKNNLVLVGDRQALLAEIKKISVLQKSRIAVVYPQAYEQLMPDTLNEVLTKTADIVSN